jgi:hypothetical protein
MKSETAMHAGMKICTLGTFESARRAFRVESCVFGRRTAQIQDQVTVGFPWVDCFKKWLLPAFGCYSKILQNTGSKQYSATCSVCENGNTLIVSRRVAPYYRANSSTHS